jgi:hypothetical protein
MTAEISRDPWATLDDLLGVEPVAEVDEEIGPVAFYGRCSTEDNQDPETSLGWQLGNARKFVEPLGGRIVAEFFDVGQSRSVPWERRAEASRLLGELKRPDRAWGAVVVGEGTVLVRQPVLVDRAPVRRLRRRPVGAGTRREVRGT